MPTKVFFCRETNKVLRSLARLALASDGHCPVHVFHRAQRVYDVVTHPAETSYAELDAREIGDDADWPTHCDCGYAFPEDDVKFVAYDRVMERTDTGEEYLDHSPPVGAVWNAWWDDAICTHTEDGRSLYVMTPGGHWPIDHRCFACSRPAEPTHACWVRHGRPEDGTLHVDKQGNTCNAGDGSIVLTGYHGFLHNGILSDNLL